MELFNVAAANVMCFFCVMLCSCQYWWCYLYVDFCLFYVSVLLLLIWLCFCCFFCKCWAVFCLDLFHIVIDIYILFFLVLMLILLWCFMLFLYQLLLLISYCFCVVCSSFLFMMLLMVSYLYICCFLNIVSERIMLVFSIYIVFFCWYLLYKHGAFKYIKTTNVIKHVWWS